MRMREAVALLEYWVRFPSEHEAMLILAMVNGWRPPEREMTEEEREVERAEELDRKFRSGNYLRPDQLAGQFGGLQHIKPGDKVPGVGPLPWAEMQLPKEKTDGQ
jgi:hypothetical protein